MPSRILVAIAATLAFATSSLAQADVWRWKDAQDKWHYSDVPVEGAQLIKSSTRVPSPQPSDAGASGNPDATQDAAPPIDRVAARAAAATDRVAAEATARQVQADIAKKRQEQCKEATARYERSIIARRMYREGKDGDRVYLNETDLAKARLEALTDRDTACGSPTR